MARFGKRPGVATSGWDAARKLLKLGVGKRTEIDLEGDAASAEVLEVRASDDTVVTVHEFMGPAAHHGNWRSFSVLALKAGMTEIIAVDRSGRNLASMKVEATGHAGVRLVFYPGERVDGSTVLGTIYVVGGNGERFAAAGGPARGYADRGGHTATPTPPGHYVLGPKHHHTSAGWPMSVVPFGASLRLGEGGEVEYSPSHGQWRVATGARGTVTQAYVNFLHRDGRRVDLSVLLPQVRAIFVDPSSGTLRNNAWLRNDFGRWSWNLRRHSKNTVFYIHTTPENEAQAAARDSRTPVLLLNSHGCIHINPVERDRMFNAGYLKEGVPFEVRRYNESGPP